MQNRKSGGKDRKAATVVPFCTISVSKHDSKRRTRHLPMPKYYKHKPEFGSSYWCGLDGSHKDPTIAGISPSHTYATQIWRNYCTESSRSRDIKWDSCAPDSSCCRSRSSRSSPLKRKKKLQFINIRLSQCYEIKKYSRVSPELYIVLCKLLLVRYQDLRYF